MLHKEAAAKLDVSIWTYRNWEYGRKVPGKLSMAELERRMNANPI